MKIQIWRTLIILLLLASASNAAKLPLGHLTLAYTSFCQIQSTLVTSTSDISIYRISQRSAFDFIRMINSISTLSAGRYNGYGNYCGVGGRGTPLDNIDRCCKAHDECLSRVHGGACFPLIYFSFYIIPYRYTRVNDNLYCYAGNSGCQGELCECDRICAECFKEFQDEYNPAYKRLF